MYSQIFYYKKGKATEPVSYTRIHGFIRKLILNSTRPISHSLRKNRLGHFN